MSEKTIKRIVELEDEIQLKNKIIEIESKYLAEELNLIKTLAGINTDEIAYELLMKYRGVWEFTGNVGISGDSLIITLPKKEAKERGLKKGTPVFLALKTLRFSEVNPGKKII